MIEIMNVFLLAVERKEKNRSSKITEIRAKNQNSRKFLKKSKVPLTTYR